MSNLAFWFFMFFSFLQTAMFWFVFRDLWRFTTSVAKVMAIVFYVLYVTFGFAVFFEVSK